MEKLKWVYMEPSLDMLLPSLPQKNLLNNHNFTSGYGMQTAGTGAWTEGVGVPNCSSESWTGKPGCDGALRGELSGPIRWFHAGCSILSFKPSKRRPRWKMLPSTALKNITPSPEVL